MSSSDLREYQAHLGHTDTHAAGSTHRRKRNTSKKVKMIMIVIEIRRKKGKRNRLCNPRG